MHRIFSPSLIISGNKISISDKGQIHHVKDVLRFEAGKEVVIFDGQGDEYLCAIDELLPQKAVFLVKEKIRLSIMRNTGVTIACAIPKKAKMDDIVDKLTQLGADRIIPLETERVIVRLDRSKKKIRLQRWREIALSAAKQSQRNIVPVIDEITDMKGALSASGEFDLKLIPTLIGERRPLKEIFAKADPKNVLVFIGPEGDFSPQEVELAISKGCIPVTLGSLVLRVDTAAIAVASFIRLHT